MQAAREAARRSQCANNLKQIALALHNYHDSSKVFPASAYGAGTAISHLHTWMESLLPFLTDASVRFVSETINYTTWCYLGNRLDNQALGDF